jgi:hypothetical protein
MADTKSITDKLERNGARGENKAKVKKAAHGKSKR